MCAPMKKPCDKTVLDETSSARSFEEEIRKHAQTSKGIHNCIENHRRFQTHYTFNERTQWVRLDVVLGVVAKTEAERTKKLQQLCNDLIWYTKDDLEYVTSAGQFQDESKLDAFIKAKQEAIRKKFEDVLKET